MFALTVSRLPWTQTNAALVKDLVHPPLHYYLLHGWLEAVGFGPLQGRLLSALFGTLAVVMMYALARYLFDRRVALLSALLLACSQLGVMYSQEARPYAQFLLFFLCCVYLFLRALREKRLSLWIAFLCLASLVIYTHYFGFFVLGSLLLFGIVYRKRYSLPPRVAVGGHLRVSACLSAVALQWHHRSGLTRGKATEARVAAFGPCLRALVHSPPIAECVQQWAVQRTSVFCSLVDVHRRRGIVLPARCLGTAPACGATTQRR